MGGRCRESSVRSSWGYMVRPYLTNKQEHINRNPANLKTNIVI